MSDLKVDGITAATANTAVTIKGLGTGKVVLGDGNLVFPDADGAAGTFITTNGSAALSFAAAGKVLQMVRLQTGAYATGTTVSPVDNTIPQNTEGNEFMTLAITPTASDSILQVDVIYMGSFNSSHYLTVALFRDSTAGALAATLFGLYGADKPFTTGFTHGVTAGSTSATTFKIRAGGGAAGTMRFNGHSAAMFGGVMASSITITEIAA